MQLNVGLGPNALKFFECYSFVCLSWCSFVLERFQTVKPQENLLKRFPFQALRFETFLVRRSAKTQKHKGVIFDNLRACGPKPTFSCTHQFENETEQKTRRENKTQGSKQGKYIIDQKHRCPNTLGKDNYKLINSLSLCTGCRKL